MIINDDMRRFRRSLDEYGYVMAKLIHEFLYKKELTREEYQLLLDKRKPELLKMYNELNEEKPNE